MSHFDRWSNWWFINGGYIHRLHKTRQLNQLRDIAKALPKKAWDEQQRVIDELEILIKHLKNRLEDID